jgi:DNA-binding transcriptional LysR family regulator
MAVPFEEDDVNAEILFEEPLIVVAGAQSQWSRRRKIKLADLLDEKWILYPPNQVVSLLIEQAFRAQGLAPPRARVLTFSLQLRDMLLMAGDYLSVIPYSMVPAFNAKRLTVDAAGDQAGHSDKARSDVHVEESHLEPRGRAVHGVRPHDREIDATSAQALEGKSTVAQKSMLRSYGAESGSNPDVGSQETNPLLHDRRLLGQPSERHGRYGSIPVVPPARPRQFE